MEDQLIPQIPQNKVYPLPSVFIGTLLGGPLITGYLTAENFKQIGETGKVKNTWLTAISATVIVIIAALLIPVKMKFSGYIIPVTYSGIAQLLVEKCQGNNIRKHLEDGGQAYSAWRAVWIGLIGLVSMLAIIVLVLLIANNERLA